jgi:transposase
VIYQKIIAAYADPNRRAGKEAMTRLITSIRRGVPAGLDEIAQLGRTLMAPPRRHPGVLRPPPLQRAHRSHQRPAWKHSAETPSDSATSPTTDCAHSYTAAHSTTPSTRSE